LKVRAAAYFALACLITGGCSSHEVKDSGVASPPQRAAATTDPPANVRTRTPGFALTNYTGATLKAVYLSPSDSSGWEENLLGGAELNDGETVEIRFSPAEEADLWDLKVEGLKHFAEWKDLRLGGVSRITLVLDVVGERVVVAEVE